MNQHELHDFLATKSLMVVSTVTALHTPQSAVVGFGITDDLRIVFRTTNDSRKYANLKESQSVSLVIGWDELKTVQLEGEAHELSVGDDTELLESYFVKNPFARKLRDLPDQRFFCVDLSWARYTDISTNPWTVETVAF